jgi:hypothetical protein
VPYLALDVGNYSEITQTNLGFQFSNVFTWTVNSSSLVLDWSNPTNLRLANNESIWSTEYNVISIDVRTPFMSTLNSILNSTQKMEAIDWVLFVINDETGIG